MITHIFSKPPSPIDRRLYGVLRAIETGVFGNIHSFHSLIAPLWSGKRVTLGSIVLF